MALKTYRALAKGYVDGKVVGPDIDGGVFTTDFRELVREEPKTDREKKDPFFIGAIKRNKDGTPVTKDGDAPSWAEELSAKEAKAVAAAGDDFADPVFEDMSKSALQAYCASNNIPFDANASKADLVAACHAQTDYRT